MLDTMHDHLRMATGRGFIADDGDDNGGGTSLFN